MCTFVLNIMKSRTIYRVLKDGVCIKPSGQGTGMTFIKFILTGMKKFTDSLTEKKLLKSKNY